MDAYLCAGSETQEIHALSHVAYINLLDALGLAANHFLTHAVEELVFVVVASRDVQGVVDRVRRQSQWRVVKGHRLSVRKQSICKLLLQLLR